MDLAWRKIPNEFLTAGFCTLIARMILYPGEISVFSVAVGMLLPFAILIGFFYFRMIGAGDIKLLMLLGAFAGKDQVLMLLILAAAAGLCCSAVLMIRYANFRERLRYFADYTRSFLLTGTRKSYRKGWEKGVSVHFTIPVWISVVLMISGISC